MLSTILVANRGEIAARIIRTVHDMGLRAVAVYADQDIDSPAVGLADEAYALGGATISETYLNGDRILEIAKQAGADAIHPGYGFLSEVPEFADAVAEAGIAWIGPKGSTITQLGDKIGARRTAHAAGVSPVPGTNDPVKSVEEIRSFASAHGFPIVAKRSDGGGGRGIVVLRSEADVDEFEARYGGKGGDLGAYFLEKFVESARHVETQCMADSHGNFAVVSTRDCSVQRRNQKLIEEAPSPFMPTGAEETMRAWSESLFRQTDYVGLGTCEFLLDSDGSVYFLEVNPRLQVEHTVSEEVTGLDLVAEQIRIASGEELSPVPEVRGHSIELRITSEDPGADLVPTAGTISALEWPTGHGIRVETGVRIGDTVSPDFDSMIAKLIVTGPDRPTTIARCLRALKELTIEGIATPKDLLASVLRHDDFAKDFTVGTRWMETKYLPNADLPAPFAGNQPGDNGDARRSFVAEIDGKRHSISLPAEFFAFSGNGHPAAPARPQQLRRTGGRSAAATTGAAAVAADGVLSAPIQSIVVRIAVEVGQKVEKGDVLLVLESMKMEKYVHAPSAGTVSEIYVSQAQNIPAHTPLIKLEEDQ